jgi:hypothetical protein
VPIGLSSLKKKFAVPGKIYLLNLLGRLIVTFNSGIRLKVTEMKDRLAPDKVFDISLSRDAIAQMK